MSKETVSMPSSSRVRCFTVVERVSNKVRILTKTFFCPGALLMASSLVKPVPLGPCSILSAETIRPFIRLCFSSMRRRADTSSCESPGSDKGRSASGPAATRFALTMSSEPSATSHKTAFLLCMAPLSFPLIIDHGDTHFPLENGCPFLLRIVQQVPAVIFIGRAIIGQRDDIDLARARERGGRRAAGPRDIARPGDGPRTRAALPYREEVPSAVDRVRKRNRAVTRDRDVLNIPVIPIHLDRLRIAQRVFSRVVLPLDQNVAAK